MIPLCIHVTGLSGAGKSLASRFLAHQLGALLLSGEICRKHIWPELGFSIEDRETQAHRMGALAGVILGSERSVVVDFICPTNSTRQKFIQAVNKQSLPWLEIHCLYLDTVKRSQFRVTDTLWSEPSDSCGYTKITPWREVKDTRRLQDFLILYASQLRGQR